jgi:hypothetical protein
LFTRRTSPESDGVRVTDSPEVRIAAFPAASLSETLTNEPYEVAPSADAAAVLLIAEIATVDGLEVTLIVKVCDDSAPESAAMPVVELSFQTVNEYTPVRSGMNVIVPKLVPAAPETAIRLPVLLPRPL